MLDAVTAETASRIVLDNSVISTFQEAGALQLMLELWPGRCVVPLDVRAEAGRWRAHGAALQATLDRLDGAGVIALTALDPHHEGALFVQLQRTLGQGESAAIAVAFSRGLHAALDDRRAQRACDRLAPPVRWYSSEGLLGLAVRDGLLGQVEAEVIWQRMGIGDPRRGIPSSDV